MTPSLPLELRCELAIDPIGIGERLPRFSWCVPAGANGSAQTAYRVLVASSAEIVAGGTGDLWDTGRVESSRSCGVEYAGTALCSRQRCWWSVCLWDERGRCCNFSPPACFEMGLLTPEDWAAGWIGSPGGAGGAARYFRCAFHLGAAPRRARLYVTGLGYYEAFVNGRKQGDGVLEPAYTDVNHRICYNVHDVAPHLRAGENVLAAVVGAGWHGAPILLAQLEIECEDGSRVLIATGRRKDLPQWSTASGPITANSIFDGESYDARREQPGWNEPGFDPSAVRGRLAQWTPAFAVRAPAGRLQPQALEPIRVVRELSARKVTEPRPGVFVFDFGQNHAGWVRLCVAGPRGASVVLRYGEVLAEDGTVNQENLRTAVAADRYTLKGEGEESWEARFTYHGYRFVQVEGWPGKPATGALTSRVVRSSVAYRGDFECSHPLLNRIHSLVRWTEESNLHGIPTDCPQRNERMGWLNDLAARSEELVFNFDAARLLEKFVADIADAQDQRTGALSDTVPFHWGRQPADPVCVAWLLIPWLVHQHYGEPRALSRHYDGFCRWVDHLTAVSQAGIVTYSHYGDWAPPARQAVAASIGSGAISAHTPGELISTAFHFYAAKLLTAIAAAIGEEEGRRKYSALADEVRTAFHRRFWDESAGGYGSCNQACNAIALHFELVPAGVRPKVVQSLLREVERHDFHLTTGNLCTKYVLEVLSAEGYAGAAMAMATKTTYPGWGFMLANGATTLWERWELLIGDGMNSHNHPMMGSIGAWLYRWVAGLALAEPRGDRPHFLMRPGAADGVAQARAALQTRWGLAEIDWQRKASGLGVRITVPWNCTATVFLPDGAVHEISSGNHEFLCESGREVQAS